MKNLALRSLTGGLFGLVVISTAWSPLSIQCVVFGLFMLQGLREFYRLAEKRQDPNVIIGMTSGLLVYVFLCLKPFGYFQETHWVMLFPFVLLTGVIELWRNSKTPLENFALYMLGLIYITVPMFLLVTLSQETFGDMPLSIGMFALIWTNDTFAYLSGMVFGKRPLFERISPKKTWEGTIGGVVATAGVAWILGHWQQADRSDFWLISGILISVSSIIGDLLESLFKRSAGVKDSGNILPGHGGVLDRFDAVLLSAPFFYSWYMLYFN
ncbi:MAG: phosphatidate cytidylyltransferase [Flavobacteriales bacterium]